MVKYLKRGIWPEQLNREGDAPIHYYVKRRDKHKFDCLVAFLIHSQSIVDLVNNDGMTALHLACEVRCPTYTCKSNSLKNTNISVHIIIKCLCTYVVELS